MVVVQMKMVDSRTNHIQGFHLQMTSQGVAGEEGSDMMIGLMIGVVIVLPEIVEVIVVVVVVVESVGVEVLAVVVAVDGVSVVAEVDSVVAEVEDEEPLEVDTVEEEY